MLTVERKRRLETISQDLAAGKDVESLTVREFIGWFNAERRGYKVTYRIRRTLKEFHLVTMPDFEGVHIDSRIRFLVAVQDGVTPPIVKSVDEFAGDGQAVAAAGRDDDVMAEQPEPLVDITALVAGAAAEPAFRVSRLLAASTKPTSVPPDCTLREAVTLMLRHDFSQLPVMTTDRDVKGVVSWESIAPKLALSDSKCEFVRDCMVGHQEVQESDSLFRVIAAIVEHSYVLVRASDRTISGIVTTTDLSLQFQQLSEPFLLLGEIENHIRTLIDGKFTALELGTVKDPADPEREIESVADLTFGEYIKLLETPAHWEKTGLRVDRKVFVKELDKVRLIRNDVMHFDPDGISGDDHTSLLNFVQFLHDIRRLAL